MVRRLAVAALLAVQLPAQQGTAPRPGPEDYPVRTSVGDHHLAADFMVRSFYGRGRSFLLKDYLAVEVALYGPRFSRLPISTSHFSLRIKGAKRALRPEAPPLVAASLRYPDWERRPHGSIGVTLGGGGVILGEPEPVERFPGDPRASVPTPPRVPDSPQAPGAEPEDPVQAAEVAIESALPEGEQPLPVSGYLYFAFKGKAKKLRSVELLYEGPVGSATLPLR